MTDETKDSTDETTEDETSEDETSEDEKEEEKEDETDDGEKDEDDKDEDKDDDDTPIDPDDVEVGTRGKKKVEPVTKKDDEEDDIDPDDEENISKIVDKKTAGLVESNRQLTDTVEADSFIREHPSYAKYRGVILKYMAHESYKNVPVDSIASIVSSKDQQKLGAQKERDATKKADETKDKGDPATDTKGGKVDWSTAPKEAFDKKMGEIKGYPTS